MDPHQLAAHIARVIHHHVTQADTATAYRTPLIGFAAAADPRFAELRRVVEPTHLLPTDLLPGARSVVSFFLPFGRRVIEANARHRDEVAREWAVAYVETNALIGRITAHLIESLEELDIRAATEPATHNFDPVSLVSRWSHKSVAFIAGLGSFGAHRMLITNAGCAGRFGSLVLDVDLPIKREKADETREHCLYNQNGTCLACVARCPVGALDSDGLDKQRCYRHLLEIAKGYADLGLTDVCGKCAIGPCSFESAVLCEPGLAP